MKDHDIRPFPQGTLVAVWEVLAFLGPLSEPVEPMMNLESLKPGGSTVIREQLRDGGKGVV